MTTSDLYGQFSEEGELLSLVSQAGVEVVPSELKDLEGFEFRKRGGVVAAYYYGEWGAVGPSYNPKPWQALQPYSDRLPIISQKIEDGIYGLHAENTAGVEWEQRQAMAAGVDVFIHNAYWFADPVGQPPGNITNASILKHAQCPAGMKFAIQWSNHGVETIDTLEKFNAAIDYFLSWAVSYPATYWKINGEPVFYVFSTDNLKAIAEAVFPVTGWVPALTAVVNHIKARGVALGLPGVFVVSQNGSDHPFWTGRAFGYVGMNEAVGFDAATVYNRHLAYTQRTQNAGGGDADWATKYPAELSRYEQLAEVYRIADDWIVNESGSLLPAFMAAICGWDRRPWLERDGTWVAPEDNCTAAPNQWLDHLRHQRGFAMKGTRGVPGVPPVVNMYAWNEYGEGGFLCPSRRYGWTMLDQVKRAFGPAHGV